MGTPRTGALGVADAAGDLYVVNSAGELTRLNKGADEEVLISKAGAVNDLGETVDLEWAAISELARESIEGDALDAIFKSVDLGGGAILNPTPVGRGTNAVLQYPVVGSAATLRGIPWQKYIGPNYSGDDLTLSIYFALNGAIIGGTDVVWEAAFERNQATHLLTADSFAALQPAAAVSVGADGEIVKATIPFTQAQADGIVAGDPLRLFIQRNALVGTDDLDASVDIVRFVLEENN